MTNTSKNLRILLVAAIYGACSMALDFLMLLIAKSVFGLEIPDLSLEINELTSFIQTYSENTFSTVLRVITSVSSVLLIPLDLGCIRYTVFVIRDKETKLSDIFLFYKSIKLFFGSLSLKLICSVATYILMFVIIIIGSLMGILGLTLDGIALIFISIFLFCSDYCYAFDYESGIINAIMNSLSKCSGHKAGIFGMTLLAGILDILVLLPFIFLPSIPTFLLGVIAVRFVTLRVLADYGYQLVNEPEASDDSDGSSDGCIPTGCENEAADDNNGINNSFSGEISAEYDYLENTDITALFEQMSISPFVTTDGEIQRIFKKLFLEIREEITVYESYEGGRSCSLQDSAELDGHELLLEITVSKESDSSPYRVCLSVQDDTQ